MNIESTPPNPEIQISFRLVYSSYSIFHQQLFHISLQENDKKKLNGIEQELIHIIYFF